MFSNFDYTGGLFTVRSYRKVRRKREFVGITGEAVKFQVSIELQIKLVDHINKKETICGKFS